MLVFKQADALTGACSPGENHKAELKHMLQCFAAAQSSSPSLEMPVTNLPRMKPYRP